MTKRCAARDTVKGTETAAQHRTHDYNLQKASDHLIIE